MVAALLEDFATLVESSLTKLVTLSLLNLRTNLGLDESAELKSITNKFDLNTLLRLGADDDSRLSIACASLTMLANLGHLTPQRSDLM